MDGYWIIVQSQRVSLMIQTINLYTRLSVRGRRKVILIDWQWWHPWILMFHSSFHKKTSIVAFFLPTSLLTLGTSKTLRLVGKIMTSISSHIETRLIWQLSSNHEKCMKHRDLLVGPAALKT